MNSITSECHSRTGHLFHPSCPGLSNAEKTLYYAANIFLKVVTLGFVQRTHDQKCHSHESRSSLEERISLLSQTEISSNDKKQLCNELIQSIKDDICTKFEQFKDINFNTNEGLQQLLDCYDEEEKKLVDIHCKFTHTNPWREKEIIEQFDLTLRLAFLIGISNLEHIKKHPNYDPAVKRSFASVITDQRNPNYRFFFFVPFLYEQARGSMTYEYRYETLLTRYLKSYYFENKTYFYSEGTKQSEWRNLYNAYCQIVSQYVSEEDLIATDERFAIHTKQDLNPCVYQWNVGTIPS